MLGEDSLGELVHMDGIWVGPHKMVLPVASSPSSSLSSPFRLFKLPSRVKKTFFFFSLNLSTNKLECFKPSLIF